MGFIGQYFLDYWALLVLAAGLWLVSAENVHIEIRSDRLIKLSVLMLLVLSLVDCWEDYLGQLSVFSPGRAWLTAAGYTLRVFIIPVIITVLYGQRKKLLWVPAALNGVLAFASIPTGIMFWFTQDNWFQRGPLNYFPFAVGIVYVIWLCVHTAHYFDKVNREGERFYIFLTAEAALTVCLPLLGGSSSVFNLAFAVSILLYYLYLFIQLTRRDSLTRLYNRQSYYADMVRLSDSVTGAVAVDMNELKTLNDARGHEAGDLALKKIGAILNECANRQERVYRVGGDEFTVLSFRETEEDLARFIQAVRERLAETEYRCSFGSAFRGKETVEELCRRADAAMYADKAEYYRTSGRDRRRGNAGPVRGAAAADLGDTLN